MKHERVLGILILFELVLGVLGIVIEYALEPSLPAVLRAHVAMHEGAASGFCGTLLTVLWVAVVAGTVLSWLGLVNLWRAARVLYLCSWVGYLTLLFLRGPVVSTSLGCVVQMLMALVGGAILGIIYFSDLRTRFRPLWTARGEATGKAA